MDEAKWLFSCKLVCVQSLILFYIKQLYSMLPCICPVIDHRGRQNVVRTSVTYLAIASCANFLFLPQFNVICEPLLDRCTAAWNLFVNSMRDSWLWPHLRELSRDRNLKFIIGLFNRTQMKWHTMSLSLSVSIVIVDRGIRLFYMIKK